MNIADSVTPEEIRAMSDEDFKLRVLTELSRNTRVTEQVYSKMFIDSTESLSIQTVTTKNTMQIRWLWAACSAILTLLLTATLKNFELSVKPGDKQSRTEQGGSRYADVPKRNQELGAFMGILRGKKTLE